MTGFPPRKGNPAQEAKGAAAPGQGRRPGGNLLWAKGAGARPAGPTHREAEAAAGPLPLAGPGGGAAAPRGGEGSAEAARQRGERRRREGTGPAPAGRRERGADRGRAGTCGTAADPPPAPSGSGAHRVLLLHHLVHLLGDADDLVLRGHGGGGPGGARQRASSAGRGSQAALPLAESRGGAAPLARRAPREKPQTSQNCGEMSDLPQPSPGTAPRLTEFKKRLDNALQAHGVILGVSCAGPRVGLHDPSGSFPNQDSL